MKKMKRIVSVLLAMVMVLGMSMTVFANEPVAQNVTGSISISNPGTDTTYEIYKMFDLETYDATAGAYVYKVVELWRNFVETDSVGSKYFDLYDNNYVTVAINEKTQQKYTTTELESVAEDIAQAAIAYANANQAIQPVAVLPLENEELGTKSYTISGLDLGYYVMDSSLGVLCNLTTVAPNSSITEKNTIPTIDKLVFDDTDHDGVQDNGEEWKEKNDANIGDVIQYKTTVHAKKGAHDYVVHDRMGMGLTLNKDSIKVVVGEKELTKNVDYTVQFDVVNNEDASVVCDFELTFVQTWLDTIEKDTDIVITYSAILNEDALIYEEANKNATKLDYGDELSTEFDITDTYTFMFDVIKTDEANKVISGAEFKLYTDEACTNEIILKDNGNATYLLATEEHQKEDNFTAATIKINAKDKVVIKGLANGTYYLKETLAPTGYNMLTAPVKVVINGANLKGTIIDSHYDPEATGNNAIHVVNKSGTLLPETGGIGTTIFYAVGGALVLAVVVVMVSRKRMSVEE